MTPRSRSVKTSAKPGQRRRNSQESATKGPIVMKPRIATALLLSSLVVLASAIPRDSAALEAARQPQPAGAFWTAGTVATLGVLLAACPSRILSPVREQSTIMRRAIEATALFVTVPYFMLKASVATFGVGAGYWMLLLSFDKEFATSTVDFGRNGNWRITPRHVTCEDPIQLVWDPSLRSHRPEDAYRLE